MSSQKEYLDYILEQLSLSEDIAYRAMMGEYIIYYKGKVVGGIYDDRFLVKDIKAAREMLPDANLEIPYDGAKKMIRVYNREDKECMKTLMEKMYPELPEPKRKKRG